MPNPATSADSNAMAAPGPGLIFRVGEKGCDPIRECACGGVKLRQEVEQGGRLNELPLAQEAELAG